jgi:type II secretory pathway component PulF
MLYKYKATTPEGKMSEGEIDAPNIDLAISALQRRNLIVVYVEPAVKKQWWNFNIDFLTRVSSEEMVVISRQLSTLFEAKVAVLDAFKLVASETENSILQKVFAEIVDDIQGGIAISSALSKHKNIFSDFYISMIRSGEESGKLSESFTFLADYLERSHDLVSRVKNALIYPAFVVVSFIVIVIIMLVVVIPQITAILTQTGQELPIATKLVIGVSSFITNYGIVLLVMLILACGALWRYSKSDSGSMAVAQLKVSLPYFGDLYRKLYLARFSDNMDTLLTSGISMIRALEVTADVVGNAYYRAIILESVESVRGGGTLSEAFVKYKEMPKILVQMIKIGEETGKLGYVLKTVARFYNREVTSSVDTIVGLIEPMMIVVLAVGVGFLLVAVLGPIYNLTSSF